MTYTQIPHVTIDVAMHVDGEPTGATTRFEVRDPGRTADLVEPHASGTWNDD